MAKGSPHNAANFNLKGKKTMALSCGCCTIYDLRDKFSKIEMYKEIKEFRIDEDQDHCWDKYSKNN